ncbi:ARF guanine-nucleotide exchange factor GNL1 [Capsicum baccatum]|uniref:ARF guanine-nucleotide exchange factor GNL1 n=1 Tax=Capsicum baccatum TaxID=33114 RepID=A0A2G2XCX9_CAPBA|nr:ARF guanine-nucleotide exchange factor GNL1 [Capsicum baccatum]
MEGEAIVWHRSHMKSRNTGVELSWSEYVLSLNERFGEGFEDAVEALKKLTQIGSVKEYQAEFDRLLSFVNLSVENQISCYLVGLKSELNKSVRFQSPRTLMEDYKLTRLQDGVFQAQASSWGLKNGGRIQGPILPTLAYSKPLVFQRPVGVSTTFNKVREDYTNKNFKTNGNIIGRRLTSAEMNEKRAKGLCFFCDEKYELGHKCASKKQLYLIDVMDEDARDELEDQDIAKKLGCQANSIMEQAVSVADGRSNLQESAVAFARNYFFLRFFTTSSWKFPFNASDKRDETTHETTQKEEIACNRENPMMDPYGVPCMVEIFHFLCSLLNVMESIEIGSRSNPIAYDEDVPLFALGLVNSAIEVSGASSGNHPELLALIQKDLFHNLMRFGLSMSPLILSTVCSIVLNLYHHMRIKLKLQLEAFFSGVLLRIAQSKHGGSYQQQEVAIETLVDFCRQPMFMPEMYANFDCDISCSDVFEDLANLLSKSSFPVNIPLSALNTLALDGLIAMMQGMAERISQDSFVSEQASIDLGEYRPFWAEICKDYSDPNHWVPFVRKMKLIKRKLLIGVDYFNRDPKKGMEFLQGMHLLPEKCDPRSVACFFRLPGESQKIQRVLEALAERYYEQSQNILADKDAALLLSYSITMLNTDQHNAQVKKKMTEEDFIHNNRRINGGNDLPREFLSELYHSICEDEIRIVPDRGPYLDYDMFAMLSGPAIAAISVVFDNVEQEDVWKICINGLLAIAKIAAAYSSDDVLNDLVVSLCKFTTLLPPSYADEFTAAFAEDGKARLATLAVFAIANKYGDHVRSGWKNILDCILSLHKLGLLPTRLFSDAADDLESTADADTRRPTALSPSPSRFPSLAPSRKSSGLMGVFSQLLYLDEEPAPQPTEQQLAARQQTLQTIQSCHIDSIFAESKFLQAESLLQLVRALVLAAGKPRKGNNYLEDEVTAVFCLELLIAITINNRDRIMLLWQVVYDYIASVVHLTTMPSTLVEKTVFGLLRICQRLLPYKENLTDELLKSLLLILKLDARVADAFLEQITREVMHLVKANAMLIRSHIGW